MAVDRVEKRLRKVTAALDAASVPYAVIGGNAVACWVGRVDPSATRATKDVDLLVDRADLDRVSEVMRQIGFRREDMRSLVLFIDPDEPSKRAGVHLVWADELVRPSYICPTPSVRESERDPEGFLVIGIAALVRMKLTSFRAIDQAHVADLLSVDLIDESVRSSLLPQLRDRLHDIEQTLDE
jgi:hypothetical protein